MSRVRGGLPALASLAAASAGTTWVALLAWRGFTERSGRFLGPLLVLAVVVAGVGALARWWRLPAPAVVAAQVVTAGGLASMMLCGSPVPVGPAWQRMHEAFAGAVSSADRYAPPVPMHAPGVHPLLIVGGLACLLLVDLLACTLRRVPLAGLPLLTVYSIPVSLLGDGISWWVFVLTAGGFMLMLFIQEDEQVSRWGRALGADPALEDPAGFGVRTGAIRTSAGTIGGVATALAVFVPLVGADLQSPPLRGWQRSGRGLAHHHREPDDRPATGSPARPGHPAAEGDHRRPASGVPADLGAHPFLRQRVELG